MKTIAVSLSVIVILSIAAWGQMPASQPASQPASAPVYSTWPFDANEAARRQDETAKALVVQKEITLKLDANVSMKLVLIPAGRFVMGSPETEAQRETNETQHEVTISKPFYTGVHAVTQEQYEGVMGSNPSNFKGATNPVEKVSWDDAVEFCKKLSAKTGKAVQLPTEAQWEYSCRAGTTTPFSTGQTISADQANYQATFTYGDGSKGEYRHKTTPVGSFKPNAFGLFDMHGNVDQWCSDWYSDNYASAKNVDPQGPDSGTARVLRGGCLYSGPWLCRSAHRSAYEAGPNGRGGGFGFRVVVIAILVSPEPTGKPADESASQPTTTSAPAKVTIDQTSVRALLLSFHQAFEASDYDAIARCSDPRLKPFNVATTDIQIATKHLFDVMDKKLGEAAGEFKEHIIFKDLLTSPFASVVVNGKIDWTRVEIEETSDTATIAIPGRGSERAKRIDGKWYFMNGPEMSKEELKEALRSGLGECSVFKSMATKLQKGLEDGSITKDNFYYMLGKLMEEATSSPATQSGRPARP